MKKIAILLAATMAFAINSNAQSMQSGYKGHVEAGYSVGIGDYDFGRFLDVIYRVIRINSMRNRNISPNTK